MKYLTLLILASCVSMLKAPVQSPQDQINALLAKDPSGYPAQGWVSDYDAIILTTLKLYPVKNLPCDPLVTIAGIVKAESSFQKNDTYMEGAPLYYSSDGLLQLSIQDESWAHCGLQSKQDLYNPIRNLYCGILIMNYNDAHYTGNFSQVQGHYWSSVRYDASWQGKEGADNHTAQDYWKANGCSGI